MPDKAAVRAEAARMGLEVAAKPDSQDICFVPTGRYDAVVAALRPDAAQEGDIVAGDGTVLGRHDGIARYTVGQARRLGPAAQHGGERQVVIGLDAASRRITVGPRGTGARTVHLREVNWLTEPTPGLRCTVKLRARDDQHPATVDPDGANAAVHLDSPALAAPGQGCVFYAGTRVLGGGFITA